MTLGNEIILLEFVFPLTGKIKLVGITLLVSSQGSRVESEGLRGICPPVGAAGESKLSGTSLVTRCGPKVAHNKLLWHLWLKCSIAVACSWPRSDKQENIVLSSISLFKC